MAPVSTRLRARARQPITNGSVLLVQWSVRQKLNRASLVRFSYVALYVRDTEHYPRPISAAEEWMVSKC